jgi:DNA-binding transcriptional ArsR family regulator
MLPGPPKITLDQESFKALASEVRVEILKRLDERRQTVTDLSNLLSLSKPTLLEHLEKLQAAGLVKRLEEGRKWIYYELSEKGRRILRPERVAIVIALANFVALVSIGLVALLAGAGFVASPESSQFGPAAPGTIRAPPAVGLAPTPPSFAWLGVVAFALAALSVIVVILLIRTQRRRTKELFSQIASS